MLWSRVSAAWVSDRKPYHGTQLAQMKSFRCRTDGSNSPRFAAATAASACPRNSANEGAYSVSAITNSSSGVMIGVRAATCSNSITCPPSTIRCRNCGTELTARNIACKVSKKKESRFRFAYRYSSVAGNSSVMLKSWFWKVR